MKSLVFVLSVFLLIVSSTYASLWDGWHNAGGAQWNNAGFNSAGFNSNLRFLYRRNILILKHLFMPTSPPKKKPCHYSACSTQTCCPPENRPCRQETTFPDSDRTQHTQPSTLSMAGGVMEADPHQLNRLQMEMLDK
uniref:Secreted protein n=1 Tax=Rhabditophanes sp. KR3021 TaxID=114890 RepID=A0AC35TKZ1_9BILA